MFDFIVSLSKPGFGPVGIFSQSGALASAILNEVDWFRYSLYIFLTNSCQVVIMMVGFPNSSVSEMHVM